MQAQTNKIMTLIPEQSILICITLQQAIFFNKLHNKPTKKPYNIQV